MYDKHEFESIIAQILSMDVGQVAELRAAIDQIVTDSPVKYGEVSIVIKRGKVYQINTRIDGKVMWSKEK